MHKRDFRSQRRSAQRQQPHPTRGGLQRRLQHLTLVEPDLQPRGLTLKVGNLGKVVKLQSCYTQFSLLKSNVYYMYDTVFSQPVMTMKAKLLLLLQISNQNKVPGAFCFDGKRLTTTVKWHKEEDIQEICLDTHKLTVRLVSTIKPDSEEYYQMVNIVMNDIQVLLGQDKIGKGYFLSANTKKEDIQGTFGPMYLEIQNFRVLGGFSTNLQRGTRPNGHIIMMMYIERVNRVLNDNSVARVYDRKRIDQLIGRDVITKHNNKTYRISNILEMRIDERFTVNEKLMTYIDYFKERYNITLNERLQPFVQTKVKRVVQPGQKKGETEGPESKDMTLSIPGELCYLCGFSDQERMDYNLQTKLAGFLKREPKERLTDIPSFCEWIKTDSQSVEFSNKWKLKIENRPYEIEGRELPPFSVISGNVRINDRTADDWNQGRIKLTVREDSKFEIDVVICDRNDIMYKKFLDDLSDEIKNLGLNCKIGTQQSCGQADVEKCLDNVIKGSQPNVYRMALVFVGDDRTYARVKSFTLQTGLLTQCVTARNGTSRNDKRRRTVAGKSLIQIFAKFGCDPWTIDMKMKPTIIVGLDTYHSKTSKKSIQASVFSINSTFTRYISFVNAPKGKQEFHENLAKNFAVALEEFKKLYQILPLQIIVYRDGVGDSQLTFTKRFEVDALKPAFERIYQANGRPLPQFIYIVVKKRISTKLFLNNTNPNPGTVVDKEIVKPNFYEFFLVSQRTAKGTVSPTNYNVLEDTKLLSKSGTLEPMEPNELQQITYAMTHLYFNWQGTIRVPVPVHYAHRLAELLGRVHKGSNVPVINDRIRTRLFYL